MREHLPKQKIRVVNVVDLMRLQPPSEHLHGLSEFDFDDLFTKDKPLIFAYHAYPWLNQRLTYRRTNHRNIHVRSWKWKTRGRKHDRKIEDRKIEDRKIMR